MNVGKLRDALLGMRSVLESAGSKKPAEDLAHVAELLHGQENRDVAAFLADLQRDLAPPSADEIVSRYVGVLKSAGTDDASFQNALDKLKKDKSIKTPEASQIAHRYAGGRSTWPSKAAALKAIEKEFVALRYNESKMKEVARSRPW